MDLDRTCGPLTLHRYGKNFCGCKFKQLAYCLLACNWPTETLQDLKRQQN